MFGIFKQVMNDYDKHQGKNCGVMIFFIKFSLAKLQG